MAGKKGDLERNGIEGELRERQFTGDKRRENKLEAGRKREGKMKRQEVKGNKKR
mgnify:CR=1 FL=1